MSSIVEPVSTQALPPVSRRWVGKQANLDTTASLAVALDLHPTVARVLVARNLSDPQAADAARAYGVDLPVTDHHHIPAEHPKATAIVHPAYPRSLYPFADLCVAGVAFKLAQLLLGRFADELLALAALATVADRVPLLRENRVLVHEGLHELNVHPSGGLAALADMVGLSSVRIEATHAAFQLASRLNALGRLGDAGRAVRLLLTDDPEEGRRLADEAKSQNRFRQHIQERLYQEALAQIAEHSEWLDHPALVVSVEDGHEGVIGIVADKLAERFYKPTLCVTTDGEGAKGSGRSLPDIHLYDLLATVQRETNVFTRFGGHAAAAGFSLAAKDVARSRHAFVKTVERAWPEDVPQTPYTEVDAPLALADLSANLVRDVQRLAPFGRENPEPIFFVQAVVDEAHQVIVATQVSNEGTDMGQIPEMVRSVMKNTGRKMKPLLADKGYATTSDMQWLEESVHVDGYVAVSREKHHGQPEKAPRGRIPKNLNVWQRMARKLRTQRGRWIYAKRKMIVEPVFGQIKECRGCRRFSLRGQSTVSSEWDLVVIFHKLLKLYRYGPAVARG